MASTAERAAALRQTKLDDVQAQIARGSLMIRTMTEAERKLNPPRLDKPLRKRRP
jgi:hypothetical protein